MLDSEVKNVPLSIVVLGCGGGREVLAFQKKYPKALVHGFDISPGMIERARQNKGEFFVGDQGALSRSYDLIWVSASIESHIQGRRCRVQFFNRLRSKLKLKGKIILSPLIRPLGRGTTRHLGSLLLKWSRFQDWEQGDSFQSYWGGHTQSSTLVFCHFYPSPQDFAGEVLESRLSGRVSSLSQKDFCVLENLNDVFQIT